MTCKQDALKLIARKAYHSQELTRKLQEKGHELSEIEEIIRYLTDLGYINDVQFLEAFSKKAVLRGWGPLEVKSKLQQKGISLNFEYQQEQAILTCIRKKRGDVLKLKQSLYRKGFSIDLINNALRNN